MLFRSALIDQARLNQIPPATWFSVASALAGDQYQFVNQALGGAPPPRNASEVKGHHISGGQNPSLSQDFISAPPAGNWSNDAINQRVALIDQLLGLTSNPLAVQALQRSRNDLLGRVRQ